MNKFSDNFINMQQEKEKEITKILSNTEYINWLISFSKNIDSFSDYNWLYDSLGLSEIDKENIKKLNLLYDGIDKYAKENFLYPIVTNNESYYRIKIDNYGFEIGVIYSEGNTYYCQKTHIDNDSIDFNDILANKKQYNVEEIINILTDLKEMITKAYNKGVPIKAINNTIDKALNEINWKTKNKTLIKKQIHNT